MTIAGQRMNLHHGELMRRLPPFAELVAFEAVARHLSFTKAAAELCITQSAISHRVRRLEKHFGITLIQRLNPGIALTASGAELLPKLAATLDNLAQLNGRGEHRLPVAAGNALCTWWLAGRLSSFMVMRPDISVDLIPIANDATAAPEADIRIMWVATGDNASTSTQKPLFNEHVFPVCSPTFLPSGKSIRDLSVLSKLKLLHKSSHGVGEWSWKVWFEHLGIESKHTGGELRFADLSLALSAAIDGSGVALARSLLVHDALRDGRLIVPVIGIKPMLSSKLHVARWSSTKKDDPTVKAFVAWLIDEAKATLADTQSLLRH